VPDVITAIEVIEHLFDPERFLVNAAKMLRPGGRLLLSTPYHGYLKNLAISLGNGWDKHFGVHQPGGHIKFFSPATLERMLLKTGFTGLKFTFVGRYPLLWKSMICVACRTGP